MNKKRSEQTGSDPLRLRVKMTGPKVGLARLAASDLAEIVMRTQQAVKRIGQVLYGEQSRGQGRKRREIEELCELFVVGWEPGSAIAALELAQPPQQLIAFAHIGQQSLRAFVAGVQAVGASAQGCTRPPAGFDLGVLQTCEALGKVLEHGIDAVVFQSRNGQASAEAVYNAAARNCVRTLLGQPTDLGLTTKTGRLEMLSGHGQLSGKLWEPDGTRWACYFKPEHLELLSDAWMHTVALTGRAVAEEGREPSLEVESMLIMGDTAEAEGATEAGFWRSMPLDELAEQQGVSAVSDLDEIADLWPADDDPDALMHYVLAERSERRSLSQR
jgi:hypothetical protein